MKTAWAGTIRGQRQMPRDAGREAEERERRLSGSLQEMALVLRCCAKASRWWVLK